ncbi:MAG TPA: aminotransferase class IV, partial [Pilimelia sp.]|nr:aminotransferase class IV [Pilimelia sp.]
ARMARSAARLDLALPPAVAVAGLAAEICAQWPAEQEGALRLVCTRGVEEGGAVKVFGTLGPIGAALLRARRQGIAVVTASLGYAADARSAAPWLLGGVKSLSYAINMASQRWAAANGVDDVLWVSADGWALEAPTSTLVWLDGEELCTVPAEPTGILPGCTARWLLDHAAALGWRAARRMVRPGDLAGMGGAWLTSSVRGIAELRAIDGVPLPASPHTGRIRELLGFPV